VRGAGRAELVKIASVRGQWIGAVLATAALPLTSLLVAATGGLDPRDTLTSGAASGSVVALLAFGTWGAALAAGEYAKQTMVVSLATVPRKGLLYAAKLGAIGIVSVVGALVSALVAVLVVMAVSVPGAHALGNPALLVGYVLAVAAVALAGAAAGILVRSPSAAIAIVVVVVLLPKAAGGLLGGLQPWIVGASPGTVVTQLVGGAQLLPNQSYPAGAWAALATMLLATLVVSSAGAVVFGRRDG
jgi:ABC-type transport system involved in multi-copper enzyme maturation permease subunit